MRHNRDHTLGDVYAISKLIPHVKVNTKINYYIIIYLHIYSARSIPSQLSNFTFRPGHKHFVTSFTEYNGL